MVFEGIVLKMDIPGKIKAAVCGISGREALLALAGAIPGAAAILAWRLSAPAGGCVPAELTGFYCCLNDLDISARLLTIYAATAAGAALFILNCILLRFCAEENLNRNLLMPLLPLGVYLCGALNISLDKFDSEYLYIAVFLYYTALLLQVRGKYDRETAETVPAVLTAAVLGWLAPAMLAPMLKQWCFEVSGGSAGFFLTVWERTARILDMLRLLAPVAAVLLGILLRRRETVIRAAVFPLELLCCAGLFAVLPPVYVYGDAVLRQFAPSKVTVWLLTPLLITAATDCIYRTFFRKRESGLEKRISPILWISVTAAIIFSEDSMNMLRNSFETGMRISAAADVFYGRAELFKEVLVTYGLWDYWSYALSAIFEGGMYYCSIYGFHLLLLLCGAGSFMVLRLHLPYIPAAVVSLMLGLGSCEALMAGAFLLAAAPAVEKSDFRRCCFYIMFAPFICFMRFPQGAVWCTAWLPAVLWQSVRVIRNGGRQTVIVSALAAAVLALFVFGPFAGNLAGEIRIVLNTAKVNAQWAAMPWSGEVYTPLTAAAANALPAVPLFAVIITVFIIRHGNGDAGLKGRRIAALTAAAIYAVCLLNYSYSRMDGGFNRQLVTWMSLLPLFAAALRNWVGTPRCRLAAGALIAAGIFAQGAAGRAVHSPGTLLETEKKVYCYSEGELTDGAAVGMPNFGKGKYDPVQITELLRLKSGMDKVLAPGEGFCGLTYTDYHHLLGRPLLLEHGNYFTVTGETTQKEMLRRMKECGIRTTLLGWSYFTEGWPAVRTHLLWRNAMLYGHLLHVSPNHLLAMPDEYFLRAGMTVPDTASDVRLYETLFKNRDLNRLPAVWGRFETGKRGYVSLRIKPENNAVELAAADPVDGSEYGLLELEFPDTAPENCEAELSWQGDFGDNRENPVLFKPAPGRNLVPLDSFARWLLAKRNGVIRLYNRRGAPPVSARLLKRDL